MTNKLGCLAFTWVGHWNDNTAPVAIRKASEVGLDVLEVPLVNPTGFNVEAAKHTLDEHGIEAYCTLVLPPELHLPHNPDGALEFLRLALRKTRDLGAELLGGSLYANAGTLTGKPPTKGERRLCAEVLGEVAKDAAGMGIKLALEPLNRYMSHLYNNVEDTLQLLESIGEENVGLHLDTYHMNIEEHGFYKPVMEAGDKLFYVHASESDRGPLGQGNVHWDDFFRGLGDIGYEGPLVMEAFADPPPVVMEAIRLWRPFLADPSRITWEGVVFLREHAVKAGLS